METPEKGINRDESEISTASFPRIGEKTQGFTKGGAGGQQEVYVAVTVAIGVVIIAMGLAVIMYKRRKPAGRYRIIHR